jgi:hypothetical protein
LGAGGKKHEKMTGILAQTITITSYGNEYLRTGKYTNFYLQNSSFQHCNSVDFIAIRKKNIFTAKKEAIIANNPTEWFTLLKKNDCKKLRLYNHTEQKDDPKLAGLVGGSGNWFIECIYDSYSDFWISNWSHDENLKDKPWIITYRKAVAKQPTINLQFDLRDVREKLKTILEQITEFAFKETAENWGQIFEKAKNTLESKSPETDFYHNDLIVLDNYALENRQLLMSASKAFVFGGMGSWNDIWFENEETQQEYNTLSSGLYRMMIKTIVSSVNKDNNE